MLVLVILLIVLEVLVDTFRYYFDLAQSKNYSFYKNKLYLRINEKKKFGFLYHFFKALFVLAFLFFAFVFDFEKSFLNFVYLILGYTFLRFGIFDMLYNILTGRHYLYIGENSFYDTVLRKIFKTTKSKMILFLLRGISIMIGMYIIQNLIIIKI